MIISNDNKFLLIGVPKTGTRTTKNILEPYSVFLKEHGRYIDLFISAKQKISDFDESKIEKIYIFWRDPVERFISGINFLRDKRIKFLMRHKPSWFPGVDLSEYTDGSLPTPEKVPSYNIPQELIDQCLAIAPAITPEQIFNDSFIMTGNPILTKQNLWYKFLPEEKLIVLDFANFEENVKRVAADFGAPADITIPKLNESNHITTSLSPELETALKENYAEDYAYKPE